MTVSQENHEQHKLAMGERRDGPQAGTADERKAGEILRSCCMSCGGTISFELQSLCNAIYEYEYVTCHGCYEIRMCVLKLPPLRSMRRRHLQVSLLQP